MSSRQDGRLVDSLLVFHTVRCSLISGRRSTDGNSHTFDLDLSNSTAAHLVNFWSLAVVLSPSSVPRRLLFYVEANFTTGPGATGWSMVLLLGILCYFALDRKKRNNFGRFQWSHLLFIPFFACWQLHGVRPTHSHVFRSVKKN
jgi:hypothetical protein